MSVPYTKAPHQGTFGMAGAESPHAALLIDFDNVTMGMRSDLSKELKTLLDSDVIKGKVSVQRAYADWRRYPQYIVPLSEASVDLIFAPAYGSNKKNATDIRMAIDALELVFIRPEIGTYILLTGDSDFSSLVLKLKEYGKYVIGVGIQESSSDILVQNCDEYYSYTSLTGLTKTTDLPSGGRDPWQLVKEAVDRMVKRDDVMRSDRLKQVMQEIDASFDEGSIGFSKFSKFLAEASSRGLIVLKKMDNGQYEISQSQGGGRSAGGRGGRSSDGRSRRGGRDRGGRRGGRDRGGRSDSDSAAHDSDTSSDSSGDPLSDAYDLLRSTLETLRSQGRDPVRDSDVKRKILERDRGFDETELGFGKFSLFLAQAEDDGVITVDRNENGNLQVALSDSGVGDTRGADDGRDGFSGDRTSDHGRHDGGRADSASSASVSAAQDAPDGGGVQREVAAASPSAPATTDEGKTVIEVEPPRRSFFGLRLGPRKGSTRRRTEEVTLLEGQTIAPPSKDASATAQPESGGARTQPDEVHASGSRDGANGGQPDRSSSGNLDDLALPSEKGAIVRYLAHRYKGVGEKTAETLVDHFGADIFRTMHERPDAIAEVVPPKRAEQVLDAWRADYERRTRAR
ncbi:MAG: NYN domain-containing protein [Gemmatimonadetes bacterium]|nr:NYN domain-containing protein [Gemmatimonadota bacterium]NNF11822.1 NYN domain-containing protein [Gemmatimonadota bacterium]